jgi:hypothetical protein
VVAIVVVRGPAGAVWDGIGRSAADALDVMVCDSSARRKALASGGAEMAVLARIVLGDAPLP